ncbi:MAG: hypothetical protein ACJ76H_12575 [Bacteriovoracaceae bacterium]
MDQQPRNNSQQGGGGQGGGGGRRRRRGGANRNRNGGGGGGENRNRQGGQGQGQQQARPQGSPAENRNRSHQSGARNRNRHGRPLTSNQVLVKYDNLLEQHLITRRKYYEYFNRVDDRQLRRLEKNFYDSIEHLRRFEANLEPWQREALEKRKTERYTIDATYSLNRGLDPLAPQPIEVTPEEIEDPHFKDSQKEAFEEYKEDQEESVGSYDDYLKYKGQA